MNPNAGKPACRLASLVVVFPLKKLGFGEDAASHFESVVLIDIDNQARNLRQSC